MEKYNAAVLLGWKVLRYNPPQIADMLDDVGKLIKEHEKLAPI